MIGLLFSLVGYALGGPWGALAGSLIGALLFPAKTPRTPAPKIEDNETFSYGEPIPVIWNRARRTGKLIWKTEITTERIKGKSHGFLFFSTSEPDTFRYRMSWAVLLAQGPGKAVTRIWADGKLIFDVTDDAPAEEAAASIAALSSTTNKIIISLGNDDQEPIPEWELADPDNAPFPAHRGQIVLTFYKWDITPFGARRPVISAEIYTEGTTDIVSWSDVSDEMIPRADGLVNAASAVAFGRLWMAGGYVWGGSDYSGDSMATYFATMGANGVLTWGQSHGLPSGRGEFEMVFLPANGPGLPDKLITLGGYSIGDGKTIYDNPSPTSEMVLEKVSATAQWVAQPVIGDSGGITNSRIPFPRDSMAAACFEAPYPWGRGIFMYGGRCTSAGHDLSWVGPSSMLRDLWFFDGLTWFLLTEISDGESLDGGGGYRMKSSMVAFKDSLYLLGGIKSDGGDIPMRDCLQINFVGMPHFSVRNADIMGAWPDDVKKAEFYIIGATVWGGRLVVLVENGGVVNEQNFHLWVSDDGENFEFWNKGEYAVLGHGTGYYTITGDKQADFHTGDTITVVGTSTFYDHTITGISLVGGNTRIEVDEGIGSTLASGTIYLHKIAKSIISYSIYDTFSRALGFVTYNDTIYIPGGVQSGGPADDKILIQKVDNSSLFAETITVREVIENICERYAEIDLSLIDASELIDPVYGAMATNRPTCEDMIADLRRFAFFDKRESNGILEFPKRGGISEATITEDELIPADNGDALVVEIEQPVDLPSRIEIQYPDIALDYNAGVQSYSWGTGPTNQPLTIPLPIIMNADQAMRCAIINMLEAHMATFAQKWSSIYGRMVLDPVDVVTIALNDGTTYRGRIQSIDSEIQGELKFQSVRDEPQIYDPLFLDGLGVPGPAPGRQSLLVDNGVIGVLFDLPLVNKFYDDFGFCWGAYPSEGATFIGADLYQKDGTDYSVIAATTEALRFGIVASAVAKGSINGIDSDHPITVTMRSGAIDDDISILGDHLLALYGEEVIEFWDVTNLGGGQYRIENYLRYQYGSDGGVVDSVPVIEHGNNENFIILDFDRIQRVQLSSAAEIGGSYDFVSVPRGKDPVNYSADSFTLIGLARKPIAQVFTSGSFDKLDNGDIEISWNRRTRGTATYVGVPTEPRDEQFERYEIDFIIGGEVEHTQTITFQEDTGESPVFTLPLYGFDQGTNHQYGQDEIYGGSVSEITIEIFRVSGEMGRGFSNKATLS